MTGNRPRIAPPPVTAAVLPAAVGYPPRPARSEVPDPAPPGKGPEVAPGQPGKLPGRQCIRCGAVGTHYLTCPGLRLPSGYRTAAGTHRGGPDHPDWPCPPRP